MSRWLPVLLVAACLTASGRSQRPDFQVTPEVPAMPKALMKLPRTPISRARFPAVDFHLHGGQLRTAEDYQKMIKIMDETGLGVICNMDGGFGATFDQNMKVGAPFRDRVIHFARLDFAGINEPGWPARTAAELERTFLAGAAGSMRTEGAAAGRGRLQRGNRDDTRLVLRPGRRMGRAQRYPSNESREPVGWVERSDTHHAIRSVKIIPHR